MPKTPWDNEEMARLSLENMDEKFLPGTAQEVDFLERQLELRAGDRIIDLGCGAGRHSIEFAKRGYRVVGVDISAFMLEEARKRACQAGVEPRFIRLDLVDLGSRFAEGNSFEAAICLAESGLGVLGGNRKDFKFLQDVHHLLRAGRKFVFTGFSAMRRYRSPGSRFDWVNSIVHWSMPVNDGKEALRQDIRVYTPSELRMMLELAGFTDVKVYGCQPGSFKRQKVGMDDIEMMLVARRQL